MGRTRFSFRLVVLAVIGGLPLSGATAHYYIAGEIKVTHPWSRATPGGAKVGGGYLKITNSGSVPDHLIGGSSPAAERLEIHNSAVVDGVASMRPAKSGLEILPGATLELAPGGTHIMLVNLKQALREGDKVAATLLFEKAGAIDVEFAIQALGAREPSQTHPGPHNATQDSPN